MQGPCGQGSIDDMPPAVVYMLAAGRGSAAVTVALGAFPVVGWDSSIAEGRVSNYHVAI